MPTLAPDPTIAEQAFVSEVVRGMATLSGAAPEHDEVAPGELTLPLGLSAWIVRAAIGLPDAYQALMRLRAALLAVSGMEVRQEPVPLRVADQRIALCSLGAYLFGLVARAARHAGKSPVELADEVLDYLGEPSSAG